MANYSSQNFLVPTSVEDKTIQIRDKSGAVKYNVNPCTVVSSFVFSNLVKIRSLGTDFVLTLDFDTVANAKQALVEFQNRVNFIKSNHPCVEKSDCDCDGLIFYQLTASTAWSFEHTLGRTPSVSVYDYTGYEIEVLTRATINNVEVYSNTGITGSIYLI